MSYHRTFERPKTWPLKHLNVWRAKKGGVFGLGVGSLRGATGRPGAEFLRGEVFGSRNHDRETFEVVTGIPTPAMLLGWCPASTLRLVT
jgi:hypothetical protein